MNNPHPLLELQSIMQRNVKTVTPDTTLYDAVTLFQRQNVSSLPVVNKDNAVCGIISQQDIIRFMLNDVITMKSFVKDHMRKNIVKFFPSDCIIDVCEFFVKSTESEAFIFSKDSLVGMIKRNEILDLLMVVLETQVLMDKSTVHNNITDLHKERRVV
ncbi:CBS domain-containing protein [bacterium]|nr:CBS domain-containing protein [bacterium]MCP5462214.1 CBS domain-containing protein [bacterium]